MNLHKLLTLAREIIKDNERIVKASWWMSRNFEKWFQTELLAAIMYQYPEENRTNEYFHTEYRTYEIDQRGGHGRESKQIDLYVAGGERDDDGYIYIELKTGFANQRCTLRDGVADDYYWLGKLKKVEEASTRVVMAVILDQGDGDAPKRRINSIIEEIDEQVGNTSKKSFPIIETSNGTTFVACLACWEVK